MDSHLKKKTTLEKFLFPTRKVDQKQLLEAVQQKTILITGASYGIGEHTAYGLAANGVTLLLVARTEDKLRLIQKDLQDKGALVYIFPADLTDHTKIDALLAFIEDMALEIDILISNAGKSICRSIYDSLDRFHDFTRTMALNYQAPVQLVLKLIPVLEKNQGQLINISAINVLFVPAPYWAAYQASKTAFDAWIRSIAPELKAREITITSVYLPLVRTRMIIPTTAYRNMPSMKPQEAAAIIFRSIISKSRIYTPWWIFPVQLICVLFRRQLEFLATWQIKKTRHVKIN